MTCAYVAERRQVLHRKWRGLNRPNASAVLRRSAVHLDAPWTGRMGGFAEYGDLAQYANAIAPYEMVHEMLG